MAIWAEIKKAINSDFSKPLNEYLDELFAKGVVKSVQRGYATLSGSSAIEKVVTINEVDMNKSIVISTGVDASAYQTVYRVWLDNETTVKLKVFVGYSGTYHLPFQVIEFY